MTTTDWQFESNSIPAANDQTWSVSYIARRGTGDGEPRAAIMIMNASNTHVSNINPTFSSRNIGGGWVRYEAIFTINYADTGYIRLRFYVTATNGGYHDFALPQLEQKPYPTSFTNGTREEETLTIPTEGVLNPQEGTIEFRIYPLELHDWNDYLGGTGSYPGGRWLLFVGASGQLAWSWSPGPEISTSSGVIVARTWYYVVLRWGQGVKSIWVNGVKKVEGSHDGSYGFPNPFGFGVYNNHDVNSLIDDLRISSRARTDEEIAAAYASGQPLPVDEWTTYKLDFDDKVRITTQGQIICNELIEI